MGHDRNYYRALPARELLVRAAEQGITPEMAIAIAEELAEVLYLPRMIGQFTFKQEENTK